MTLVERFVDQVQSQPQAVALRTRSSDGAVLSHTWKDLGDRVCVCRSVLERYLATGYSSWPGPACGHLSSQRLAWIVIDLAVQSLAGSTSPLIDACRRTSPCNWCGTAIHSCW